MVVDILENAFDLDNIELITEIDSIGYKSPTYYYFYIYLKNKEKPIEIGISINNFVTKFNIIERFKLDIIGVLVKKSINDLRTRLVNLYAKRNITELNLTILDLKLIDIEQKEIELPKNISDIANQKMVYDK